MALNHTYFRPLAVSCCATGFDVLISSKVDISRMFLSGSFYLKHKSSGMCLAFDSIQERLVLRKGACNQTFNEVPETKFLQWEKKKCIRTAALEELTLADECTSYDAAFKYILKSKLITFNGDNCIWHNQADSHEEHHDSIHNTPVTLRSGCSNEDKLKFKKVYIIKDNNCSHP